MNYTTAKVRITPFQAFVASGSDVSNPDADHGPDGYQLGLARELHRIGPGGGTITLDAAGFRDLGEWAHDLSIAVAQEPNPPGARSLAILSERCFDQARLLDGGS